MCWDLTGFVRLRDLRCGPEKLLLFSGWPLKIGVYPRGHRSEKELTTETIRKSSRCRSFFLQVLNSLGAQPGHQQIGGSVFSHTVLDSCLSLYMHDKSNQNTRSVTSGVVTWCVPGPGTPGPGNPETNPGMPNACR
jgi:hypothetical protein